MRVVRLEFRLCKPRSSNEIERRRVYSVVSRAQLIGSPPLAITPGACYSWELMKHLIMETCG